MQSRVRLQEPPPLLENASAPAEDPRAGLVQPPVTSGCSSSPAEGQPRHRAARDPGWSTPAPQPLAASDALSACSHLLWMVVARPSVPTCLACSLPGQGARGCGDAAPGQGGACAWSCWAMEELSDYAPKRLRQRHAHRHGASLCAFI